MAILRMILMFCTVMQKPTPRRPCANQPVMYSVLPDQHPPYCGAFGRGSESVAQCHLAVLDGPAIEEQVRRRAWPIEMGTHWSASVPMVLAQKLILSKNTGLSQLLGGCRVQLHLYLAQI